MTLGALLLIDSPIPEMRVHLLTALSVSVPLGLITAFLMGIALRARRNKIVTGQQGLVGEIGITQSALAPIRQRSSCTANSGTPSAPSTSQPENASRGSTGGWTRVARGASGGRETGDGVKAVAPPAVSS